MVTNPLSVPNASSGAEILRVGLHVLPTPIWTPDEALGSKSTKLQFVGNPDVSIVMLHVPASRPVEVMSGVTSCCPPGNTRTGSDGTPILTL